MGQRVLRGAFGAEAVLGRRGRGAAGLSSARPEVLDAEAQVGASLIKAAAGAGGLPARGCGRARALMRAAGPGSRGFGGQVRASRLSRHLLAAAAARLSAEVVESGRTVLVLRALPGGLKLQR